MGGKPKQPEVRYMPTLPSPVITPSPPISPMPTPVPTETAPIKTAEARRKKIAQARYGILSTIKTSPLGIVGAGAELGPGGKRTLGA